MIKSRGLLTLSVVKDESKVSEKTLSWGNFSSLVTFIKHLTILYNLRCNHDTFFRIESFVSMQYE